MDKIQIKNILVFLDDPFEYDYSDSVQQFLKFGKEFPDDNLFNELMNKLIAYGYDCNVVYDDTYFLPWHVYASKDNYNTLCRGFTQFIALVNLVNSLPESQIYFSDIEQL